MEKLAGDLLFGSKLVKLSILPILFVQFFWGAASRSFGFNVKE